jgi:hypothetical protein
LASLFGERAGGIGRTWDRDETNLPLRNRRDNNPYPLLVEINITPLLDVMPVVLILFMVTDRC